MSLCELVFLCIDVGITSRSVSRSGHDVSSNSRSSSASISVASRSEGEILQSSNLKSFSYHELRAATRNFRPDSVLGEGGFGSVFKGWIDEHSLAATKPGIGKIVAVKKLNQDGLQGHREWLVSINWILLWMLIALALNFNSLYINKILGNFKHLWILFHSACLTLFWGFSVELYGLVDYETEVWSMPKNWLNNSWCFSFLVLFDSQAEINYLGQLQHPNLVKLIGYCFEDEHRLLVYEFMPKGSMENHLFRS